MTSTQYLGADSPENWNETAITKLLDTAEAPLKVSMADQNLRNARFIRKRRSVGMVPGGTSSTSSLSSSQPIKREALDETVLRVQEDLDTMVRGDNSSNSSPSPSSDEGLSLPYCACNGDRDVWVDVGNKRVGCKILQSYLGVPARETLHIGDQFLNTGNDYAARQTCPCIWITSPEVTTYVLKSILRLAGIHHTAAVTTSKIDDDVTTDADDSNGGGNDRKSIVDFAELERRTNVVATMDVFTGEIIAQNSLSAGK